MKTFIKKSFIVFLFATAFMFLIGDLIHIGDNNNNYVNNQILYDLDYPQTQLNNHSLRKVFEDENVFSTPRLVELKRNSNRTDTYNISITANNHYYYLINVVETNLTTQAFTRIELIPYNNIQFSTIGYHSIIDIKDDDSSSIYSFILSTEIDSDDYYIYFYQTALINLDFLGISHLHIEQLEYWYSIYNTLKGLE